MWKSLGKKIEVAEKMNNFVVKTFLKIYQNEFTTKDLSGKFKSKFSSQVTPRTKVITFLELFGKFKNPKALYQSKVLYEIFLDLLSSTDSKMQLLAVDCIMTWKFPYFNPYEPILKNLIDDKKFREQITKFTIEETVEKDHREQFIPFMMRILYGQMLRRKGTLSLNSRRKIVLSFVASCSESEISFFVDILVKPLRSIMETYQKAQSKGEEFMETMFSLVNTIPFSLQLGFLNMTQTICHQIGNHISPSLNKIIIPVIYLVGNANKHLQNRGLDEIESTNEKEKEKENENEEMEMDEEDGDNMEVDHHDHHHSKNPEHEKWKIKNFKEIRQTGIESLAELFSSCVEFNFEPYLQEIYSLIIKDKINLLSIENTQHSTGLIHLFQVWAMTPNYIQYLWRNDLEIIQNIYKCLPSKNLSHQVLNSITLIIENLFEYAYSLDSTKDENIEEPSYIKTRELIIGPNGKALVETYLHVSLFLQQTQALLKKGIPFEKLSNKRKDEQNDGNTDEQVENKGTIKGETLYWRLIGILSLVSSFIEETEQAELLVHILFPNLRKPLKVVPENTKVDILQIIHQLFHLFLPATIQKYYVHLSQLFSSLPGISSRMALCEVFVNLSIALPEYKDLTQLVCDLNSNSTRRVDQPDWEKRLSTYALLNENLSKTLSPNEWIPVLHNLVFFMHEEDMSIRNSASFSVQKFVERIETSEGEEKDQLFRLLLSIIYPAIKRGLKSSKEVIRNEFLTIFDTCIRAFPNHKDFSYLVPLLSIGDEETNFFSNIRHIQSHRRIRALRKLGQVIKSSNGKDNSESKYPKFPIPILTKVFLPFVSNIILEIEPTNMNLVEEGVLTIGSICSCLPWSSYFFEFTTFTRYIHTKPTLEKIVIKVLVSITNEFHFTVSAPIPQPKGKGKLKDIQENITLDKSSLSKDKMEVDEKNKIEEKNKTNEEIEQPKEEEDEEEKEKDEEGEEQDEQEEEPEEEDIEKFDPLKEDEEQEEENQENQQDEEIEEKNNDEEEKEEENQEGKNEIQKVFPQKQKFMKYQKKKKEVIEKKLSHSEIVHETIVKNMLPTLHKYLTEKDKKDQSKELVRVPVALAILNLLKILPKETMEKNLPTLILKLAQFLKERDQNSRDTTRTTLIKIANEIGPFYLSYIVKELRSALTRGYQLHVLGYTVHALLIEMVPKMNPGEIDSCVEVLIPVIINEVFGEISEEKEVEALTNKSREAKSTSSYESMELISKSISFNSLNDLLKPLQELMLSTDNLKTIKKIEELLRRISVGLISNTSIDVRKLLVFVNEVLMKNVPMILVSEKDREKQRKKDLKLKAQLQTTHEKMEENYRVYMTKTKALGFEANLSNNHLLVEFALGLFNSIAKKDFFKKELRLLQKKQKDEESKKLIQDQTSQDLSSKDLSQPSSSFQKSVSTSTPTTQTEDQIQVSIEPPQIFKPMTEREIASMVLPLLNWFKSCVISKHNKTVLLSIKAMSNSLERPLIYPTDEFLSEVTTFLFDIVTKSSTTSSDLVQSIFNLLIIVIKSGRVEKDENVSNETVVQTSKDKKKKLPTNENETKKAPLTEAQLKMLIKLIQPDLEDATKQSTTFSLIKAILSRKMIVNEVYDLMTTISEISIRSQSQQIREVSRAVFIKFLLDYPLGQPRLQKHIEFIVENLAYDHESGRQSAMELVIEIFEKFPKHVLLEYVEFFFFPLILRMINDESQICRKSAATTLSLLFTKLPEQNMKNIHKIVQQWFESENPNLQRAAAQTTTLLLDHLKLSFRSYLVKYLRLIVNCIIPTETQNESNDMEIDQSTENWEPIYYSLTLFIKLGTTFSDILFSDEGTSIVSASVNWLLHPHQWIRAVSSRVLGLYFSLINPETLTLQAKSKKMKKSLFDDKFILFKITRSLSLQIRGEHFTDSMGTQAVKNLFFIGKCFHSHPELEIQQTKEEFSLDEFSLSTQLNGNVKEGEEREEEEKEEEEEENVDNDENEMDEENKNDGDENQHEDEEDEDENEEMNGMTESKDEEETEAQIIQELNSSFETKTTPFLWLLKKMLGITRIEAAKNNSFIQVQFYSFFLLFYFF